MPGWGAALMVSARLDRVRFFSVSAACCSDRPRRRQRTYRSRSLRLIRVPASARFEEAGPPVAMVGSGLSKRLNSPSRFPASPTKKPMTNDRVRDQYEHHPYPARNPKDETKRLITGSPGHLDEVNHYLFAGRLDWRRPLRILFAGGGTGDGTLMLAQQLADRGSSGRGALPRPVRRRPRGGRGAGRGARPDQHRPFIPARCSTWSGWGSAVSTTSTVAACCITCPSRDAGLEVPGRSAGRGRRHRPDGLRRVGAGPACTRPRPPCAP